MKPAKSKRRSTKSPRRTHARSESPTLAPELSTVLLAVTGMSPAVLTETVWALAHPAKGVQPIVPQRVVAITTLPGKGRIEDELFTASADYGLRNVWDALRQPILGSKAASDPRLILDDIRVIAGRDPK